MRCCLGGRLAPARRRSRCRPTPRRGECPAGRSGPDAPRPSVPDGPGPFGLALSLDGKFAVTANGGPNRYSLTLLDQSASAWQVRQIVAPQKDEKSPPDDDDWESVFLGLAFDKDRRLYASEGNSGRVRRVSMPSGKPDRLFELNQGTVARQLLGRSCARRSAWRSLCPRPGPFPRRCLRHSFRKAARQRAHRALALQDGPLPRPQEDLCHQRRHVGLPGAPRRGFKAARSETGIDFPAFGFPSKEASEGVRRETARGSITCPASAIPTHRSRIHSA